VATLKSIICLILPELTDNSNNHYIVGQGIRSTGKEVILSQLFDHLILLKSADLKIPVGSITLAIIMQINEWLGYTANFEFEANL